MESKCPKCNKELSLEYIDNDSPEMPGKRFYVCHDCKKMYEVCEVYSRVVGYLRPVGGWNKGKQEEFKSRVTYKLP